MLSHTDAGVFWWGEFQYFVATKPFTQLSVISNKLFRALFRQKCASIGRLEHTIQEFNSLV